MWVDTLLCKIRQSTLCLMLLSAVPPFSVILDFTYPTGHELIAHVMGKCVMKVLAVCLILHLVKGMKTKEQSSKRLLPTVVAGCFDIELNLYVILLSIG